MQGDVVGREAMLGRSGGAGKRQGSHREHGGTVLPKKMRQGTHRALRLAAQQVVPAVHKISEFISLGTYGGV